MDIIAGVLLYVLPELDAYFALQAVLTRLVPLHFVGCSKGALLACNLVDECLICLDPELRTHLVAQVRSPVSPL